MGNFLVLNCHDAIILRDSASAFEAYEGGVINCHDMIISPKMQGALLSKGMTVNCHDARILDVKGEIAALPENAVIDRQVDYIGKFVLAKGNLILRPEGADSLDGIEGIHVSGTFFYPESYSLGRLNNPLSDTRAYPDEMRVITGGKTYDTASGLETNGAYYISGKLRITEEDVAGYIAENNIRFICESSILLPYIDKL
ncbi:hypothetical protein FACS1894191_7540 [Clostridia bacterium]|nr:hypothetical protein FACS1894191_7540 [Clostridia bacterium]